METDFQKRGEGVDQSRRFRIPRFIYIGTECFQKGLGGIDSPEGQCVRV